jgi:hypothetical protein
MVQFLYVRYRARDEGSYSYAEINSPNSHAATSVGGTSYSHDNNGNVTSTGLSKAHLGLTESLGESWSPAYVAPHDGKAVPSNPAITSLALYTHCIQFIHVHEGRIERKRR